MSITSEKVIEPAVSVIMPTYNQAKFIRRAIASLHGQSFSNWELIIINDGSTDNTEDIVEEYLLDERVRHYFTVPIFFMKLSAFRAF
jgi:glycosyltransferase involved in cell wall biosynthesis